MAPDPLATVLRGLALALLVPLVVFGLPGSPAEDGALDGPDELILKADEIGAERWPAVLRHAAEAPVRAVVSGCPPPVRLDPPRRVRAERVSALRVQASEPVRLVFEGPEGGLDTMQLAAREEVALLLRPFSEGWRTWRVRAERDDGTSVEQAWSALVEPARSLRILAVSGPPDPESRLALRALEEAGEQVEAWIHLGRDQWVGRPGGALPTNASAYADVDVVLLFPGIELTDAQARALTTAARVHGKGLLLAATSGGAAELTAVLEGLQDGGAWQGTASVPASELMWSVPPEITPLPDATLTARTLVAASDGPEGAAGTSPGASPLRVGPLGRGRVAALGLTDSWRWRMEGGAEDAHRAFWRETAAWLAGGFSEDPLLELLGADARVGEPVLVRRLDMGPAEAAANRDNQPSPGITVTGSDHDQTLPLTTFGNLPAGAASVGGFVPSEAGLFTVAPSGSGPGAGAPLDEEIASGGQPPSGLAVHPADAPTLDPAGRLARIAVQSPGGSVVVAGPGTPATTTTPTTADLPWRALLFAVFAVLLPAEWALRRLGARP
ncbi:MAG TPA: hypothetical protein VML54_03940 [Candidatus Limnocylindrales bacterium]|nr:hypothetical protein [Candidatus Limnocylindrales bacterium]